jgi:hypothetical protein
MDGRMTLGQIAGDGIMFNREGDLKQLPQLGIDPRKLVEKEDARSACRKMLTYPRDHARSEVTFVLDLVDRRK